LHILAFVCRFRSLYGFGGSWFLNGSLRAANIFTRHTPLKLKLLILTNISNTTDRDTFSEAVFHRKVKDFILTSITAFLFSPQIVFTGRPNDIIFGIIRCLSCNFTFVMSTRLFEFGHNHFLIYRLYTFNNKFRVQKLSNFFIRLKLWQSAESGQGVDILIIFVGALIFDIDGIGVDWQERCSLWLSILRHYNNLQLTN
jgi:hypothetical protein